MPSAVPMRTLGITLIITFSFSCCNTLAFFNTPLRLHHDIKSRKPFISRTNTMMMMTTPTTTTPNKENDSTKTPKPKTNNINRRNMLTSTILSLPTSAAAMAADPTTTTAAAAQTLSQKLRKIPVFAIVDSTGRPFCIYGKKSRVAIRYFFLTYEGALYVLNDAKAAAEKAREKEGEDIPEEWVNSKITVVPMDLAMTLTFKKRRVKTVQNDMSLPTVADIIPAEYDLGDAKKLDRSSKFDQKGRVPLFYYDQPTLSSDSINNNTPVYFHTIDLTEEWKAQHPDQTLPGPEHIRVMELMESTRDMLNNMEEEGGGESSFSDLEFHASKDSLEAIKQLMMSSGDLPKYRLDEMIAVGGNE